MKASFPFLIAATLAASCSGSVADSPNTGSGGTTGNVRCSTDAQCAPTQTCVLAVCVQRDVGSAAALAFEIRPPADSGAAVTEGTPVLENGSWKLFASAAINAAVVFVANGTSLPTNANVVFEVPSLIPGRPALSFESTLPTDGTTLPSITVPDAIRQRVGTLTLIPLVPADQSTPPYRFSVAVPAGVDAFRDVAENVLTLPRNNQTPHGLVWDSFMTAKKGGYTVRAYQNGSLVSNVATLRDDGTYVLFVPAAVTTDITIELAPSGADPWFTFDKMTFTGQNPDLGTVTLPAYAAPDQMKDLPVVFTALADDANGTPVAGATLRAVTLMTSVSDYPGVTRFWRELTTDAAGAAKLYLIPGANRVPRPYDVSVVPPPGSPYASTCLAQLPVLGGGDSVTIRLARRPLLSGTVSSDQGVKLAGVSIVATRDPAQAKVCAGGSATGPTTFTTTTDMTGAFLLSLDAGTYQLDFDPPSGSPAPRLTEFGVAVGGDTAHPVRLPSPGLIEGDVRLGDTPVPNATIRIFTPRCVAPEGCTMAPLLRAETYSDVNGHFRAIVSTN